MILCKLVTVMILWMIKVHGLCYRFHCIIVFNCIGTTRHTSMILLKRMTMLVVVPVRYLFKTRPMYKKGKVITTHH